MLTICWAAKGGSGTTVVAATLALSSDEPTLLVDLAGDTPAALGLAEPDGPGVYDWMASDADGSRLERLEVAVDVRTALLPAGRRPPDVDPARWHDLADVLRNDRRHVVVDAGTGPPPPDLVRASHHAWLVTRACYLSLRAAVRQSRRPTGVVLVEEHGRALRVDDVEATIGAPVVATLLVDPAVARAVDAGLLVSRLPRAFARQLRNAA